MTFKQAQELGGNVRKGEHGSSVVYANTITKTEHNDETDEDEEHKIPFMKGYMVFNVEQIDNLPAQYYATAQAPQIDPAQRMAKYPRHPPRAGTTPKAATARTASIFTASSGLTAAPTLRPLTA